jgi:Family of unknown function (DUF6266)
MAKKYPIASLQALLIFYNHSRSIGYVDPGPLSGGPFFKNIIQTIKKIKMAKLKGGALGGFTGKLGNIVGYYRNGVHHVKKAPGPRKTPPTLAQLQVQARFKLLNQFFSQLKGLLDHSFKNSAKSMSCVNKAVSVNKTVIAGDYPSYRIDYAQVMLSKYVTPGSYSPRVICISPGILEYSWTKSTVMIWSRIENILFVAAYCEKLNKWIYRLFTDNESEEICCLDVTAFGKYTVHTYIGFSPIIGNPTSKYTGPVYVL